MKGKQTRTNSGLMKNLMNKWQTVTLNDICEFIKDGTHQTPTYAEDGFIFLSSKNVTTGVVDWEDVKYIPEDLHEKLYKALSPQINDILLAKNGTTGVAAIVDKDIIFDVYVSLAVLRPNTSIISPRFLLWAVNSPHSKIQFNQSLKGIGVPNLHLSSISKTTITLPPLDIQNYIVSVLDKLQSIIIHRKQQLSKLDELVKARFVEMTQSDKSVIPTRMGDIASYINGYAFKPTDWTETGKPIIRIQNLNDLAAKFNFYSGELDEKYAVSDGDILVSWATHLEAYIWNRGDAWLNQHIFKSVFDKMTVNKIYFVYATEEALRQAFKNAHGFKPTMEHIKRSDFENAIVQLPSLETQNQFAAFVEQTDKSKVAVQKALDEAQLLFDSLMQEYFG